MAQDVKGQATGAFDASIGRIRDLNDRIVDTARKGGEASLQAYERLLQTVADVQQSGGSRTARFVEAVTKAQASFVREVASASPEAAKRNMSQRRKYASSGAIACACRSMNWTASPRDAVTERSTSSPQVFRISCSPPLTVW